MVRGNAQSEQSLITMLQQSAEQAKAILPEGQGTVVATALPWCTRSLQSSAISRHGFADALSAVARN